MKPEQQERTLKSKTHVQFKGIENLRAKNHYLHEIFSHSFRHFLSNGLLPKKKKKLVNSTKRALPWNIHDWIGISI